MTQDIAKDPGFVNPNPSQADTRAIIKVVGVGGGGGNAVNNLYHQGVNDVSLGIINTDGKAIAQSPIAEKIVMGGLGAGDKPEVARQAALQCRDQIRHMLDDGAMMVFITASMGGGTGTGASPVVAEIAREMGLLTVAIVNTPFAFEGKNKMKQALSGIRAMQEHVDAMIVINNQRLIDNFADLPMHECFAIADNVLARAARSISHLISVDGYWNIDFNDISTTLRDGRSAIISEGVGMGEHRVTKALEAALESPLLRNRNIYDASRLLINVYCNPDIKNPITAREVNELTPFKERFGREERHITGWCYDRSMGDEVRITILASGFDLNLDDEDDTEVILLAPGDIDGDTQLSQLERPTYRRHSSGPASRDSGGKSRITFD